MKNMVGGSSFLNRQWHELPLQIEYELCRSVQDESRLENPLDELAHKEYGVPLLYGGLQNGTRVPRGGFVAAKPPAKWGLGCEIENFQAWRISQSFRSCEMRGMGGLRNGTRMSKGRFVAAKIFAEGGMGLRNHFAAMGQFHSGYLGATKLFRSQEPFSQGPFQAAKFHRPCLFLAFELFLIPNFLLSISLQFLLILIIQKY